MMELVGFSVIALTGTAVAIWQVWKTGSRHFEVWSYMSEDQAREWQEEHS